MDHVRECEPSIRTPVDVKDFLGRCLGRLDLAERILQKFQTSLESDVKLLEEAVLATNADEIAHLAHRIKGASLAVSARELTDCAKSIEVSATTRRLEDIPVQLARLKRESSRVADIRTLALDGPSC
jgi:HPt (histidine-containing phosphotransfer) domain-containing protein